MAYKGKYIPKYPIKYKGNTSNIIYRSLLERRFMQFCDENIKVLWWSSEELNIPYISPVDGKWHRYFVDFVISVEDATNSNISQTIMVEIKPKVQCSPPKIRVFSENTDRRNKVYKRYVKAVCTWGVNSAKWNAAEQYCNDKNWKFKIITEKDLKV